MFQALSKCLKQWIKVDKLDYFKNASQHLKNSFVFGADDIQKHWKAKLESAYSFMLKYSKNNRVECQKDYFNALEAHYDIDFSMFPILDTNLWVRFILHTFDEVFHAKVFNTLLKLLFNKLFNSLCVFLEQKIKSISFPFQFL